MSTARYVSPLRYPGGKATMAAWLAEMFNSQAGPMDIEVWLEPFAGGAGAALTLLDRGAVDEAWLVDANPGIAAFWQSAVDDGAHLARLIESTAPTMGLYRRSRELLEHADGADRFDLGYAAFIVNRCSRSGIVSPTSGPMGGINQAGARRLTERFNGPALAERVRHIHDTMRHRLRVTHGDGIAHLEELDGSCGIEDELVVFVDPPYIREGNRLYANGMDEAAHRRLADALNGCAARWMLTYDDEPAVSDELYPDRRVLAYEIRNTANRARLAREFAVFSDNLTIGELPAPLAHGRATWVRPRGGMAAAA